MLLSCIVSFIIGGFFGFLIAALCAASSKEEYIEELEDFDGGYGWDDGRQ